MRPQATAPYSWLKDPSVPDFDPTPILVVMDGDCALCSAAARRIARLDRHNQVRITTSQSDLGRSLLAHFGLDPDDPETWLLLSEGNAYGSLDAIIRLFPRLSPLYSPLRMLNLLPIRIQDWLYARIARNRYALWGRGNMCALPDPELRQRLIP